MCKYQVTERRLSEAKLLGCYENSLYSRSVTCGVDARLLKSIQSIQYNQLNIFRILPLLEVQKLHYEKLPIKLRPDAPHYRNPHDTNYTNYTNYTKYPILHLFFINILTVLSDM